MHNYCTLCEIGTELWTDGRTGDLITRWGVVIALSAGLGKVQNELKICYDKAGNLPSKGRNFNTQTWGKIVYFLFV